jgi:hypothetical protein
MILGATFTVPRKPYLHIIILPYRLLPNHLWLNPWFLALWVKQYISIKKERIPIIHINILYNKSKTETLILILKIITFFNNAKKLYSDESPRSRAAG